jgi:hypothetical protein
VNGKTAFECKWNAQLRPARHRRQILPAMRKMIDFYGLTASPSKTSIAATLKIKVILA